MENTNATNLDLIKSYKLPSNYMQSDEVMLSRKGAGKLGLGLKM
jgi:hypothetical protein